MANNRILLGEFIIMSRYFYAQIDESNTVIAVSDLSGPVESNNMIAIDELDNFLIGKVWNGINFTGESLISQDQQISPMVPSQYFRNRFTNEELYAIYGSNDITIKIWLDDLRLKPTVNIDSDLENILSKMVTLEILTQERSEQILQQCNQYAA
jgi:hypothetical protein